jgi:hypothetical protein
VPNIKYLSNGTDISSHEVVIGVIIGCMRQYNWGVTLTLGSEKKISFINTNNNGTWVSGRMGKILPDL